VGMGRNKLDRCCGAIAVAKLRTAGAISGRSSAPEPGRRSLNDARGRQGTCSGVVRSTPQETRGSGFGVFHWPSERHVPAQGEVGSEAPQVLNVDPLLD
jgi:hypothetical protein